jgi:hypothetical protein
MGAIRTLRVPPDGELSRLLHDALASGEPVTVDTGEAVYRVDVATVHPKTATSRLPTPEETERSRAGIREAAGSWREADADAFKAYIRERRRTANRPPVKL